MYKLDGPKEMFGFIAHPRTGSRSTRNILCELGAKKNAGHHQIDEPMSRNILQRGGFLACTTRNMFDVLVSWYFNAHFNNKGEVLKPEQAVPKFETYINGLIDNPPLRWFQTPVYHYGLSWCYVVVRYENLEADFNAMLDRAGFNPVKLGHVGKSIGRDPDYRKYYTPELRRQVEERWATDLHLTGCEF